MDFKEFLKEKGINFFKLKDRRKLNLINLAGKEELFISKRELGEWAWQQLPIKNVIEEWETNFKDEGDEVSLFSFCCDAFVRSDKQEDDFAEEFLWQITLACLGEEIIKEKLEELKQ